jgi:fused signal recognition particle receptor
LAGSPGSKWFGRVKEALSKSRDSFAAPVNRALGRTIVDDDVWEDLEEALISADAGLEAAMDITKGVRNTAEAKGITDPAELKPILIERIAREMRSENPPAPLTKGSNLKVLILVGVNGTGKTTTAGKMAFRISGEGGASVIAAADTFRAAAIEQAVEWAAKSGTHVVKHARGGDSAAVAFDAVRAAESRKAGFVIIDTAGRLHTKTPLMDELKKVKSVIEREAGDAEVITLLVMDATTGQNGLVQAKAFAGHIGLDGLVLTKLDGTAKGGIAIAVAREMKVPVVLIGTGEKPGDLADFDAEDYAAALVER